MKRFITVAASLLALACISSPAQDREDFRSGILARCEKVKSIKCDFVQVRKSSLLSDELKSSGTMSYEKPDRLEWEYLSPVKYTFSVKGEEVAIIRDGRPEPLNKSRDRLVREMSALIISNIEGSFLSGDMFSCEFKSDGKEVTVTLFPASRDLKRMWSDFVIHYNGDSYEVTGFEMHETSGDVTLITFNNCQYGF